MRISDADLKPILEEIARLKGVVESQIGKVEKNEKADEVRYSHTASEMAYERECKERAIRERISGKFQKECDEKIEKAVAAELDGQDGVKVATADEIRLADLQETATAVMKFKDEGTYDNEKKDEKWSKVDEGENGAGSSEDEVSDDGQSESKETETGSESKSEPEDTSKEVVEPVKVPAKKKAAPKKAAKKKAAPKKAE